MKLLLVLTSLWLCLTPAHAEQLQMGVINLKATASTDIENDELLVQLKVFEQGKQTAQLNQLVNTKTALLLDTLKNFPTIEVKTTQYATRPTYQNGKIDGWQVSQQVQLKTTAFEQMSQLMADINSLAQVDSMRFQISKARADDVKKQLIKQAIADFKDKALLITQAFEAQSYDLVSLSVESAPIIASPIVARGMMMESDSLRKSSVPAALEGGSNTVSVDVYGSVQLNQPVN